VTRAIDPREYVHENLGDRFATAMSRYDTERRVETLIDEFLTDDMVRGKSALDVGCGLGHFSERLHQRGASVLAADLGPNLVERTVARVGCEGVVVDALRLVEHFGRERFDLVVSSECIEHTPSPREAVRQMCGVLKPGGYLSLSTPNLWWHPVVAGATSLGLRPFTGYENFSTWGGLRRVVEDAGLEIVREQGLHLFPFQLRLDRLSRWCDRRLQRLRGAMINLCLLARRPPVETRRSG